jgi:TonB family protein
MDASEGSRKRTRILSLAVLALCISGCGSQPTQIYTGNDPAMLALQTRAIKDGDPQAEFEFARRYELGIGVPVSNNVAMALYADLTKKGNVRGIVALADMYLYYFSDEKRAADLYGVAAERGDCIGAAELLHMYAKSYLVKPKDPAMLARYRRIASCPAGKLETFGLQMHDAIAKQNGYPVFATEYHRQGAVRVSFDYAGDGRARDITIVGTRGDPTLDQQAIKAVKEAALPPFPTDITGSHHFVIVEVFTLAGS